MAAVPIHVCIPFRNHVAMTARLVETLIEQGDVDTLHLFDNGSTESLDPLYGQATMKSDVTIYSRPRSNLTEMWNEAWSQSLDGYLAILNNDITVPDGFLRTLAWALAGDSDLWVSSPHPSLRLHEVTGTAFEVRYTEHVGAAFDGMAGWAFMVDTRKPWPHPFPIDPQFQWWCGDNDVAYTAVKLGGKVGVIHGLACDHEISRTWSERMGELAPIAEEDMERCRAKWGAAFP